MELTKEDEIELEKWERKKEDGKYKTCWVCGSRVLKQRIEQHHVIEKSDLLLPLCIICHDIVDRMDISHPNVFYEFMGNVMKDFSILLKEGDPYNSKLKWIKLYILKSSKFMNADYLKRRSSLEKKNDTE